MDQIGLRLLQLAPLLVTSAVLFGQTPADVLVVVNQASAISKTIGEYYVLNRHVPLANVCRVNSKPDESISRQDYNRQIATPIANCLRFRHLREKILYIVTTAGVPLKIAAAQGPDTEAASVDSELTLLYSDLKSGPHRLPGYIPNPFYGARDRVFRHPDFPIYLVTRLAGYDFAEVKGIVDRALLARNLGKFVIDLRHEDSTDGDEWLREAASRLPHDRVLLDDTTNPVYNQQDVIGYASWGSNDPNHKQRHLNFHWLPGAIMTEYVSTNARTFAFPPDSWNLGNWSDQKTWFAGSPQSLTADYIHDGVTGASGHVYEPYLNNTPRPNILLPAYYQGRNLAESYYLSIPAVSWMNVVIGDPLCSLGKPPQ